MADLTLDHVVIAVRDLEAATADYTAILGRRPSWRGEHPKYGTRNTLFRIHNTYIELLAPAAEGGDKRWSGELRRHLEDKGEGLYALALGTVNIRETLEDVREAGLEVANPADGHGVDADTGAERAWRNALADPRRTNGLRVFFIQHLAPPEALPIAEPLSADGYVRRMDHAVVLSADMEAARRVWGDVMGVRLALDRTFPERNTRILFFRLADITIEISGGATQTREGIGKPDRLWGMAWGVDSIEKACARMADAGIETSGARPGIKPGTIVATVKGPQTHGVATLLIEHTPQSFETGSRLPTGQAYDNAPQQRAFATTALDHISVTTPDLFSTAGKWAAMLGLAASEAQATHDGLVAKVPIGHAFVALTQPADGSAAASALADRGQGMHAIALTVDDLDAAVRDLRAKGVDVSDSAPGRDPGSRVAVITKESANGVPVMLVQRP
jgi:catechol 2,3-dioxygenase-like lactoylglutathione lyase family enzyme